MSKILLLGALAISAAVSLSACGDDPTALKQHSGWVWKTTQGCDPGKHAVTEKHWDNVNGVYVDSVVCEFNDHPASAASVPPAAQYAADPSQEPSTTESQPRREYAYGYRWRRTTVTRTVEHGREIGRGRDY